MLQSLQDGLTQQQIISLNQHDSVVGLYLYLSFLWISHGMVERGK